MMAGKLRCRPRHLLEACGVADERVDELAKGMKAQQEPQYFRGRDAEDYVLARW
jgi:hypothetical protein